MATMTKVPRTVEEHNLFFGGSRAGLDGGVVAYSRCEPKQATQEDEESKGLVSSALNLMKAGHAGQSLDKMLRQQYATRAIEASKELQEVRAKYEGLLGRVYHDPSMFVSCNEAAQTLKANTQADQEIVLKRMAKCATCSLRSANRCGLMKKSLVTRLEPTAQKYVQVRVKRAVRDGEVQSITAGRIVKTAGTAVEVLKGLNIHKKPVGTYQNEQKKLVANAFAPILQRTGMQVTANKVFRKKVTAGVERDYNKGTNIAPKQKMITAGKIRVQSSLDMIADNAIKEMVAHPLGTKFWSSGSAGLWAQGVLEKIRGLEITGHRHSDTSKGVKAALVKIVARKDHLVSD